LVEILLQKDTENFSEHNAKNSSEYSIAFEKL